MRRGRAILLLIVMAAALVLSSSVALAVTKHCKTDLNCNGTKERDKLLGTDGSNFMYGKGSGDTLKGFGGSDILYGLGGSDKLFGGASNDLLYPGPGNDTSDGGEGEDYYIIEARNWGKDTINDPDTTNHLEFKDLGTDLTINLVSDPNRDEVSNAGGTKTVNTINWPNNVISYIRNDNNGTDTIEGNPAANVIFNGFGKGRDWVYAGGGNDYIDVRDGDPDDHVDCGGILFPDNDEVHYDTGDVIDNNCEIKKENF